MIPAIALMVSKSHETPCLSRLGLGALHALIRLELEPPMPPIPYAECFELSLSTLASFLCLVKHFCYLLVMYEVLACFGSVWSGL